MKLRDIYCGILLSTKIIIRRNIIFDESPLIKGVNAELDLILLGTCTTKSTHST